MDPVPGLRDSYIRLGRIAGCNECSCIRAKPWPKRVARACPSFTKVPIGIGWNDSEGVYEPLSYVRERCTGKMVEETSYDGAGVYSANQICAWLKACESCGQTESQILMVTAMNSIPGIIDACSNCCQFTLKAIGIHSGQMSLMLWKRHVAAVICAQSNHLQVWNYILSYI